MIVGRTWLPPLKGGPKPVLLDCTHWRTGVNPDWSAPWAPGGAIAAIGAGLGIGKIGAAANEGIARQPEAAKDISGGSLILAAFIEGVALFAVVVSLLVALG